MESYNGVIISLRDALLIIEATRLGIIPKIKKRLKEHQRAAIRAGDVFVWDEIESNMKRWTDGRSWSASRVSHLFLTYKEMEPAASDSGSSSGSFVYKEKGLIKQSFSIATKTSEKLHLIYYTDINSNSKTKKYSHEIENRRPSNDPRFAALMLSSEIYPEHLIEGDERLSSPLPDEPTSNRSSFSQGSDVTSDMRRHSSAVLANDFANISGQLPLSKLTVSPKDKVSKEWGNRERKTSNLQHKQEMLYDYYEHATLPPLSCPTNLTAVNSMPQSLSPGNVHVRSPLSPPTQYVPTYSAAPLGGSMVPAAPEELDDGGRFSKQILSNRNVEDGKVLGLLDKSF